MKKTLFKGAGVAIVTPFNDDLTVNYDKLRELLEFHIAHHTDAIIICGTTGEAATLTDQEHRDVIKFAVDVVAGRIPVIAGTGSNDTEYSLSLSKFAKDVGADGLLLVTPYYNKCTQKGLIEHFTYIADNVDLPIILYSVPSRTGVNITPATCKILSQHKNIVAIKEASGNISQVAEIIAQCGDSLDVYSGNDDQIVPLLSLGGSGVISVLSNIMPKEAHDICQLYFDGKTAESAKLQLKLLPVISALFCEVNPIPVKEALNQMGMKVGGYRKPLCTMEDKNIKTLQSALKDAGLI